MQLLKSSDSRNRNAFDKPLQSVMAGTRRINAQKQSHPWRSLPVIGRDQGQADLARRWAIQRGGI